MSIIVGQNLHEIFSFDGERINGAKVNRNYHFFVINAIDLTKLGRLSTILLEELSRIALCVKFGNDTGQSVDLTGVLVETLLLLVIDGLLSRHLRTHLLNPLGQIRDSVGY